MVGSFGVWGVWKFGSLRVLEFESLGVFGILEFWSMVVLEWSYSFKAMPHSLWMFFILVFTIVTKIIRANLSTSKNSFPRWNQRITTDYLYRSDTWRDNLSRSDTWTDYLSKPDTYQTLWQIVCVDQKLKQIIYLNQTLCLDHARHLKSLFV